MNEIAHFFQQLTSLDPAWLAQLSPVTIFFAIVVLTWFTEEGACLLAGALVANGTIVFPEAVLAGFTGICIGDIGFYWLGRLFGSALLKFRIFRSIFSEAAIERAGAWLEARGATALFLTRFVAGLRIPTYLAAGFLRFDFRNFLFWFVISALIWTPLVVGATAYLGRIIAPGNLLILVIILFGIYRTIIYFISEATRQSIYKTLQRFFYRQS
ncbi:MAG: DedA family protein [Pyrinomonadaceae bacterium]